MNPFSLLIKPASADCNLNCEYCFYLEKCDIYPETRRHRMSDEVLEKLISSYLATDQPFYSFGWQGGEPTLMGTAFFKKVVKLQQKYGRPGSSVGNGLQTNATLITDEMATLFADYKFLLGCSLDGPAEIHDLYRQTTDSVGSHERVVKGIDLLSEKRVEFNILVLVSQANVHRAEEVYQYLVEEGHTYHQYIPCVEFDEKGDLLPYAISGSEWGDFLCRIYDLWYPKDAYKVSIRQFDAVLNQLVDGNAGVCTMGNNCCQYFVVEYNGDVYPCDFFVDEPLRLGNILSDSWDSLLKSPLYRQFGARKKQWHPQCETCEVLPLCQGDCIKHRVAVECKAGNLSRLCDGWQQFYTHSAHGFEVLAESIRQQRLSEQNRAGVQNPRQAEKVGRNNPCPCGSGKKYKKCCGKPG